MPVMAVQKANLRKRARHGYTLLELTISMPLLAMLMLGIASAISLSARSLPDGKTMSSAVVSVAGPLDQLGLELSYATAISARSPSDITFTTPDRNGNGSAEILRYRWGGTAGDPLLRTVQGGSDEAILASVQQFTLTYDAPVDAETGLPLLKNVQIDLRTPAGATTGIHATIETLNRPQLP